MVSRISLRNLRLVRFKEIDNCANEGMVCYKPLEIAFAHGHKPIVKMGILKYQTSYISEEKILRGFIRASQRRLGEL